MTPCGQLAQQIPAVPAGQTNVSQEHIELLVGRLAERLTGIDGEHWLMAEEFQHHAQDVTDVWMILHHQNA